MDPFPCTDEEWEPVRRAALASTDALVMGDEVLQAVYRGEIRELVAGLLERYPDHPALLETLADHTDDDAERADLYRRAIDIASANGLPTLSIRLFFAPVLVNLGRPEEALDELRACGSEATAADADEKKDWLQELCSVADDAPNAPTRPALYRRATDIAASFGLPTLRIRLGFVRFLLDEGRPLSALEELRACEGEAREDAEDGEWWAAMFAEATG